MGAIVTVASGGAGASGQLAADSPVAPSPGAGLNSGEFDELTMIVPQRPGVDGRIGSDKPARADVPVQGATDGRSVVRPGRPNAVNGIPRGVFPAYRRATANLAVVRPNCGLTWPLLAGIGKVESNHASGGRVDVAGTTRGRLLGPVLNGRAGLGKIPDTDRGRYDADRVWDRAVGPMQIVPGVWSEFGADGNGDSFRNPNNVYDAVTTVAVYLCSEGDDLKRPRDLVAALLRYQHSKDFVATVLRWMRVYSKSAVLIPNAKGNLSTPKPTGNAERKVDPRDVPDVPDDTKATATPKPLPSTPVETSVPRPVDPTPPVTDRPTRPTSKPTRPPSERPTPTPTEDTPTPTPTPTPDPTPTPTPTPSTTPSESPTGSPCATEGNPTPCTQGSGSHG
ncbi:lytic transglycosylase domain-containing protein [Kribbella sp. ALI-6-A]|uniref:lytic transglycosylase domain-containing protein n=1 Tax=Kribbella sp. ALI-6-A TaxID=1933817 RepID=UPI001EDBFE3A|nr:lytic transglycosylase domain-containing protein [Kribbella sp. ALI-6-A]